MNDGPSRGCGQVGPPEPRSTVGPDGEDRTIRGAGGVGVPAAVEMGFAPAAGRRAVDQVAHHFTGYCPCASMIFVCVFCGNALPRAWNAGP